MRMRRLLALGAALALFGLLMCSAALAQGEETVNGVVETVGEGDDAVTVLYTWGTPYEMGYAHGKLLTEGVKHLTENTVVRFLIGLGMSPEQVLGVWDQAEPFIPKEDLEELQGLADGSGVDVRLLKIMHICPEISEWHCSFFAAWGSATRDGGLIQIRALDYATEAAIQKYPLITVAYPAGGQPYANVGWQGFTGLVSGTNASGVSMSEIGEDWDENTDTFEGIPMTYLMKDVVRKATTLDEAVGMVEAAPRTSCYLYCLSDAKIPSARALQTSHEQCIVYDPETLPHEKVADAVYLSMGVDSPWCKKVGDLLKARHGSIDSEFATMDVMRGLGTGDLQAVCFDLGAGKLLVANAEGDIPDVEDGFNRPFTEFDLTAGYAKVKELAGQG